MRVILPGSDLFDTKSDDTSIAVAFSLPNANVESSVENDKVGSSVESEAPATLW